MQRETSSGSTTSCRTPCTGIGGERKSRQRVSVQPNPTYHRTLSPGKGISWSAHNRRLCATAQRQRPHFRLSESHYRVARVAGTSRLNSTVVRTPGQEHVFPCRRPGPSKERASFSSSPTAAMEPPCASRIHAHIRARHRQATHRRFQGYRRLHLVPRGDGEEVLQPGSSRRGSRA